MYFITSALQFERAGIAQLDSLKQRNFPIVTSLISRAAILDGELPPLLELAAATESTKQVQDARQQHAHKERVGYRQHHEPGSDLVVTRIRDQQSGQVRQQQRVQGPELGIVVCKKSQTKSEPNDSVRIRRESSTIQYRKRA
jgi:hypothetical protein